MKTKVLSILAAGCLLIVAARLVQVPNSAQADGVPETYRESVAKGLKYLASKQHKDGHWEGDDGNHPVAMTGLAGLAMLMEREHRQFRGGFIGRAETEVKREVKHWANVRKAADWLIEKSQARRDGLIFSDHPSETTRYMQGHGLATIFLAGVHRDETDESRRKKLAEVLTKSVKYIVDAQSTQGGWHDTSKVEGHDFASNPASVIQVQALQAAQNANFPIPSAVDSDGQQYLKTSLEKGSRPADMAGALACLGRCQHDGSKTKFPQKWFDDCRAKIPVGRDVKLGEGELAHYYFAQAEHHLGGEVWNAYRTAMFDRLRMAQNKDGSWPAGDGTCVGQVYSAAVWCTVLQLDNDSHPSKQQIWVDVN